MLDTQTSAVLYSGFQACRFAWVMHRNTDLHVLTWMYTHPQGFIHREKQLGGSFIKPLGGRSILELERGNQPFVESIVEVSLEQE